MSITDKILKSRGVLKVILNDIGFDTESIKELSEKEINILFNLSSDDAVNLIKRINPKLAIITHFGKDMMEVNPVYQAREITKITGIDVIAAEDGTSIDPVEYASKTRQKKLEGFNGPDIKEE